MRAILHIHNDTFFCDRRIGIEVEIPCRPAVGDCFYLDDEQRIKLDNLIEEKSPYKEDNDNYNAYHEWFYKDQVSVEDAIFVVGVSFWPVDGKDDEFELHFELGDSDDLKN